MNFCLQLQKEMEVLSSCFISHPDISYCFVGGNLTGDHWTGSVSLYNDSIPETLNDDLQNKSLVRNLDSSSAGCVNSVCWTPKHPDIIICGTISGALLSTQIEGSDKKLESFTKLYQHNSSIEAMDTLADIGTIISGNDIGQIVLLDIETSTPLFQWCHSKQIIDIASRNKNTFCSSSYGGEIHFWDNRINKNSLHLNTRVQSDEDPTVSSISFQQKNDNFMAISMLSNGFRVYDLRNTEKPLINEKTILSKPSFRIKFSPHQDDLIAIGSDDSSVKVYDITNSKVIYTYNNHKDKVRGISWHEDKKEFISASWDRTVIKHILNAKN